MQSVEEIEKIMQECNSDVISVICHRLKTIGELTHTDAIKLSNLSRTEDLNKIMDIISSATEKSLVEVSSAIESASKENDDLAEQYYKAKNLDTTVRSDVLSAIMSRAEKAMKDDILNLSGTAGFYIDGKPSTITETYTKCINRGIYATQQGFSTYQQSIRGIVGQLADSGLRVVDFESGYSRRLDSQVRMNVLDGIRQMNMEYREQQGKEFGADGVEISVHNLCAIDHLSVQGRQYSLKKFEKLQEKLKRPIGLMNCKHSTFPIILGISEPVYDEKRLKEINDNSTREIEYTDKKGNKRVTNGYESTQLQRKQETVIRRLKDKRNAYDTVNDDLMVKELNKKIKAQTKYYKDMSAEVGLKPKQDRIRAVKSSTSATIEIPKIDIPKRDVNPIDLSKMDEINNIIDLENWFKQHQLVGNLTKSELDALADYGEGGYQAFNAVARYEKGTPEYEKWHKIFGDDLEKYQKLQDDLSNALNKFNVDEDLVLHRAIRDASFITNGSNNIDDLVAMVGKTYTDKGFVSTSPFYQSKFEGMSKDAVHMEIIKPKDAKGGFISNYVSKDESEFLLDKGQKYKILDAGERDVTRKKYNIKTGKIEDVVVREKYCIVEVVTDETASVSTTIKKVPKVVKQFEQDGII